jgi:hypothetical protein
VPIWSRNLFLESGNLELRPYWFSMEHRGVRYEVERSASPAGWKWVVHLPTKKTGFSRSQEVAVFGAERAIDEALGPEKNPPPSEDPRSRR